MDLWIRSQDKRKLLKCNDIAVEQNMIDQKEIIKFEGYKIVGYFDKNTEYEELGIYATKERALEVLDEIQNILQPEIIVKPGKIIAETCDGVTYREPDEVEIQEQNIVVYQMPEE